MIPRSNLLQQLPIPTWQQQLADAVTDPKELLQLLELDAGLLGSALAASEKFRLRVPHAYLSRIRKGDPLDPLLLQVLPLGYELIDTPGFTTDPLDELHQMPVPGLLHKYKGRVLLTLTGACAIHCRYCFRRHYPYSDANPGHTHWPKTLKYLREHTDISEVILSGGDPLSLSDNRLSQYVTDLESIEHIKRLRIHTRLPIVVPARVNHSLLEWTKQACLKIVMVVHTNHPNEIDVQVDDAMHKLRDAGVSLLNQSVLLRGINDHSDTLAQLSEQLFNCGVLPYYLHQLDPVQGAAHFSVDDITAKKIVTQLRDALPGYLIPRLAREIAGQGAKIILA